MSDERPPLVFIDVDGVINAVGDKHGRLSPNRARHFLSVEVPAGDGETVTVLYRPDVVARLRDLSESGRAEFVWLTTWRHIAREHVAPLIGLPDWEAIPHPIDVGEDTDGVAAHQWDRARPWWKTQGVLDRTADGRQFAWLDDDLAPATKRRVRELRPQPSLLVTPPSGIGLTSRLVAQLELFCGVERDGDDA